MKFGVLGYRHPHIEMFIQEMIQMGHEFIGVCEKVPETAKPLADKYKVPLFLDEEELFSLKPQIIGTSAVNNQKISVIESCRSHGVHVMADKPIVTNMKDYQRLAEIINEECIQIGLMLTERFNPPIYTLYNMVRQGKLGSLISISIAKPHKLNSKTRAAWHFSKEENGGIIVDLLVHDFDLLRYLTDSEVDECSGYIKKGGHKNYPDFYDSTQILVKMKNNIIATVESDWWIPDSYRSMDGRIFCVGTEGRVEVRTIGDLINLEMEPYAIFMNNEGNCTVCKNDYVPITLAEDFVNRVQGKPNNIITHADILKCTYATLFADMKALEI